MKLTEILKLLEEKVAPVALSDELCKKFDMYDNSGIIVNCGNDICGAVFSLDLSKGAIADAREKGYNLIVTHHPAIYGGLSRIDYNNPVAANIAECVKSGISVISMHLNFDCAPEGIDYHLMKGLRGDSGEKCEILAKLSKGGYGRFYQIKPTDFNEITENIKTVFKTERVIAYGCNKTIKSAASFCGAGCDDRAISFAAENGADVFVSSDMPHHEITALLGRGINVVLLTHYASENYGFNKIYNAISTSLQISSAYHTDDNLL
ncbi:MAG: Nif3-like dinuclear metal center hexameric protein [Clostridia bacterium]|nr:Nif3-like dinuclear metal center hexameric protein [Clostridia bacterium]